jgi:hypothetical protein
MINVYISVRSTCNVSDQIHHFCCRIFHRGEVALMPAALKTRISSRLYHQQVIDLVLPTQSTSAKFIKLALSHKYLPAQSHQHMSYVHHERV